MKAQRVSRKPAERPKDWPVCTAPATIAQHPSEIGRLKIMAA
ncbi:hypothetical protein RHECNPAF_13300140 [Rhizobium etli CNPAF512]|nr:hypothetical protein RHECNPAF_13300140 [Rhizobium etli CNPAF512]